MHPLDGAYIRLNRAIEHFTELKSLDEAYIDKETDFVAKEIKLTVNPETGAPQVRYPARAGHQVPGIFSVIVGEIIYNIRASLDYLVYELARSDSGIEQQTTQFPIQSTQEGFRGNRKRFLKGVNDAHMAAIERLQPYNGTEWTKRLADISNPDKHRHLSVHAPRSAVAMRQGVGKADETEPWEPDVSGVIVTLPFENNVHGEMYMQVHIALFVVFNDGSHVMRTLALLITEVVSTLEDFKPEF